MELFASEEFLVRSNNDRLVLTTHRLHLSSKEWGQAYSNTLFLEDISSVEIRYSSFVLGLMIGGFLILGGLMWAQQGSVPPFNAATIAGGVFVLFYFLSRRHLVSITPNGGKPINFEIGSMSNEEVNDFIHKVQLAKERRRFERR